MIEEPDRETARRRYEIFDARKREDERTGLTYHERVRLRTLRKRWGARPVEDR